MSEAEGDLIRSCYFCERQIDYRQCDRCRVSGHAALTNYSRNTEEASSATLYVIAENRIYYIDLIFPDNQTSISYWAGSMEQTIANIDGFPINPSNAIEYLNRILKLKAFQ